MMLLTEVIEVTVRILKEKVYISKNVHSSKENCSLCKNFLHLRIYC